MGETVKGKIMAKSDSSAGDVAGEIKEFLERKFGETSWIDGEHDVIGAVAEDGTLVFVKVELA